MQNLLFSPQALHTPDGFLSITVSILFWLISAAMISIAVRRSGEQFEERQIPLMGIMAAFIFAGQMINFPVAGGTSGHLLGGALAAIVLGPWGGILAMTAVVGVQALLFQDGGLLAMGANIFNMGILTALLGYGLYALFGRSLGRYRLVAAGFAAWLSVMGSAFFAALQLWMSGSVALGVVMPVMLGVHALIGIGEALITTAALAYIFRVRPDVPSSVKKRSWALAGSIGALGLLLLAPFASIFPDGFERAVSDLGIRAAETTPALAIFPDYILPPLGEMPVSTLLAGLLGMLVVLGMGWLFIRFARGQASNQ